MKNHLNPDGKLIVGFYDPDLETNEKHFDTLASLGINFSKKIANPFGTNLVGVVN